MIKIMQLISGRAKMCIQVCLVPEPMFLNSVLTALLSALTQKTNLVLTEGTTVLSDSLTLGSS